LLSLIAAASLIAVASIFDIKSGDPDLPINTLMILYMNPLARLFEFVTGMYACLAWQNCRYRLNFGFWAGTALEACGLAIFIYSIIVTDVNDMFKPWFLWWAFSSHTAIPSAMLIFALAFQKGALSKILSIYPLVFLGEISYALYLIHYPLLRLYWGSGNAFTSVPHWIQGGIFLCVLFTFSFVIWAGIEKPLRHLINGTFLQRIALAKKPAKEVVVGAD